MNVPLEAWNLESISKIASRIGNPIIMDRITTSMCEKAYGMASFDRVLVEVDAGKELLKILECVIKGLVDLWRLRLNTHGDPLFVVFGHGFDKCTNRELIEAMKKHIASGVMVSQAVIPSPNGPGKRHTTTRDTVPCLAEGDFGVMEKSGAFSTAQARKYETIPRALNNRRNSDSLGTLDLDLESCIYTNDIILSDGLGRLNCLTNRNLYTFQNYSLFGSQKREPPLATLRAQEIASSSIYKACNSITTFKVIDFILRWSIADEGFLMVADEGFRIMLFGLQNYNAKLSDFGLTKDGPADGQSHVSTRVMGNHGYAALCFV
ncbi:hypothetical protein Tco_0277689 [Tanacetum coccineum]